jgi:hypothetical protein
MIKRFGSKCQNCPFQKTVFLPSVFLKLKLIGSDFEEMLNIKLVDKRLTDVWRLILRRLDNGVKSYALFPETAQAGKFSALPTLSPLGPTPLK